MCIDLWNALGVVGWFVLLCISLGELELTLGAARLSDGVYKLVLVGFVVWFVCFGFRGI